MVEVQSKEAQLEQAKTVADELATYEGMAYSDDFLAHLQEVNAPLLQEFIESQKEGVLKKVDTELGKWEQIVAARELEAQKPVIMKMIRERGFDPTASTVEIRNGGVDITLPCPGRPFVIHSSVTDKSQDEWTLDGCAYIPGYAPYLTSWLINGDWGTLEEVLEDAATIRDALTRVGEGGDLKSDNRIDPFKITSANSLLFDGIGKWFNTFEAVNRDALAKRINERYRELIGEKLAAAPAVAEAPAVATQPAVSPQAMAPEAVAAAQATMAEDVETPVEAAVEKPAPTTEAEFAAMLHENGNRAKYMTESTVGEDTEVTIHLPTKNDVRLSRIQHFVGDDSAMMGLSDVSKYQVLSGGNTYEWQDGTWKDLSKPSKPRLLVYDGTKYTIHKKEEAAEPAPVVAEVVPATVELTKEELAAVQAEVSDIGHTYEVVRAEEIGLDVTIRQAHRKGQRMVVGPEKTAEFAAKYRALEARVAALDGKMTPEQVAVLKPITEETSKALARLESKPTELSPVIADGKPDESSAPLAAS